MTSGCPAVDRVSWRNAEDLTLHSGRSSRGTPTQLCNKIGTDPEREGGTGKLQPYQDKWIDSGT